MSSGKKCTGKNPHKLVISLIRFSDKESSNKILSKDDVFLKMHVLNLS